MKKSIVSNPSAIKVSCPSTFQYLNVEFILTLTTPFDKSSNANPESVSKRSVDAVSWLEISPSVLITDTFIELAPPLIAELGIELSAKVPEIFPDTFKSPAISTSLLNDTSSPTLNLEFIDTSPETIALLFNVAVFETVNVEFKAAIPVMVVEPSISALPPTFKLEFIDTSPETIALLFNVAVFETVNVEFKAAIPVMVVEPSISALPPTFKLEFIDTSPETIALLFNLAVFETVNVEFNTVIPLIVVEPSISELPPTFKFIFIETSPPSLIIIATSPSS